MVLPGEASDWTVYQGNKREPKGAKECLLIYDKKTNQLKLEKLTSNIVVKKVR